MAATRLIALHKNKGKSVATCLKSRTDYAQNPEKTKQGELVSSYECSPLTVDEEFMLSKRQYELATGRRQKSDVIAYQIRQSFKPGEITAEEANKVGYELAMRFTKGKYGMARFLALYQGEYSRERLILRLRTVHPKTITRLAQNDTGNVADRHMKQILSIYNGAGRTHNLPCKR